MTSIFEKPIGSSIVQFQSVEQCDPERKDVLTKHQCISGMDEYSNKSLEEIRMEDYTAKRKGPQKLSFPYIPEKKVSTDGSSITKYKLFVNENLERFECITAMKEYEDKSIEEIRMEDYMANRTGGVAPNLKLLGSTSLPFGKTADELTTTPFGQNPQSGTSSPGAFNKNSLEKWGQQTSTFVPTTQSNSLSTKPFEAPVTSTAPFVGCGLPATNKDPFGVKLFGQQKPESLFEQQAADFASTFEQQLFSNVNQTSTNQTTLFANQTTNIFESISANNRKTNIFGQKTKICSNFGQTTSSQTPVSGIQNTFCPFGQQNTVGPFGQQNTFAPFGQKNTFGPFGQQNTTAKIPSIDGDSMTFKQTNFPSSVDRTSTNQFPGFGFPIPSTNFNETSNHPKSGFTFDTNKTSTCATGFFPGKLSVQNQTSDASIGSFGEYKFIGKSTLPLLFPGYVPDNPPKFPFAKKIVKSSNKNEPVSINNEQMQIENRQKPENNITKQNVGTLSVSELLDALRETIKEEIGNLSTRDEIDTLKTDVKVLKDETEESIKQLKDNEKKLENKIDHLEKMVRLKNIIITGLPTAQSANTIEKLTKNLIMQNLGIGTDSDFERIIKLSEKGNKMMVLVTFKTVEIINEIFSKTQMLKGTSIYIGRDLSETEREIRRILQRIRSAILNVDKSKRIELKNNRKLVVDGKEYLWKDGRLMAGEEDGISAIKMQYGDALKNINLS